MKASKQRVVMKVLDFNRSAPQLNTLQDVAMNKSIVDGLQGITANKECKLNLDVKHQLIEFLINILVMCDTTVANAGANKVDSNIIELEQVSMDIIINILRNDFDAFDVYR